MFLNILFFWKNGEIVQDTGYGFQSTPDLHGINQDHYEVQQQQWNQQPGQLEYNEGSIPLMETPAVESQSELQPSSLSNVQEPYNIGDDTDQYGGPNIDSTQYQQMQQQNYWNQQTYNQPDQNHSEWQQQPSQYMTEQPEMDNNQQGNWGYEV